MTDRREENRHSSPHPGAPWGSPQQWNESFAEPPAWPKPPQRSFLWLWILIGVAVVTSISIAVWMLMAPSGLVAGSSGDGAELSSLSDAEEQESAASDMAVMDAPLSCFEAQCESSGDTYGENERLDALWDSCAAGDLGACDDLFMLSALDSDYESFGESCGERQLPGYMNWCDPGSLERWK